MNILKAANGNLYKEDDLKHLFQYAFNLAKSDYSGSHEYALNAWRREYTQNNLKKITTKDIVDVVFNAHLVATEEKPSGTRSNLRQGNARMISSWFAYTYTKETLTEIAEQIGYKQHASVLHGYKEIEDRLNIYKSEQMTVEMIQGTLIYMNFDLTPQNRDVSGYIGYWGVSIPQGDILFEISKTGEVMHNDHNFNFSSIRALLRKEMITKHKKEKDVSYTLTPKGWEFINKNKS
jgi:hypothetical protein